MAELLGAMLRVTLLLLALGCVSSKRFSIMAPSIFHIGVEEKVSVTVFDAAQPVTVKLYLQDYPHRRKTFSEVQAVLQPQKGSNAFLTVKVEPKDLPDTNSVDKQYVYLVAKSDDAHFQFHKEARILLSYRDGMVFIQTDKPIYTPRQTVRIRVIPLEFDTKPYKRKITVVTMNPQGVRVEQWKDLDTSTGIITKDLVLSDFIIKGNWTVTALYGHQNVHSTSVKFVVKEHVLPKFSVELSVPPYILKTDQDIKVKITARYTYGKPVVGVTEVRLSIAGVKGQLIPFATHQVKLDRNGATTVEEKVSTIRDLPGGLWFPEKSRLQVQADVIERATGTKETVVDKSCQFTSSPYLVEVKTTPKFFKPGLPFVVKVVVTHPNKQPAESVPIKLSATGLWNERKNLKTSSNSYSEDKTNKDGEVEFRVDSCADCQTIRMKVRTNNEELANSQNAVASYVVKAFDSGNGPLIMVHQPGPGKVISRGRILSHDTSDGNFKSVTKSWSFIVSPEMSPSARLIVYYFHSNGEVVADSILLKIEDSLPTVVEFPDAFKVQADGRKIQLNEIEKIPGENYAFRIKAPQGTRLGLLGVEKSVYLLRNENRLTKNRILKTIQNLDLGCGGGGGKDNKDIFKNAGVVFMTDNFVSDGRNDYGCVDDGSRKKRSAEVNSDTALLGRSLGDDSKTDEDYLTEASQVRTDFPEAWIWDQKVAGSDGLATLFATIPDTITTWIMQAVAINNETGLGLATPLRIVSRKDVFVSLKMPYSVKRGEQVSLVATAFNYGEEELQANIYIKGGEDFCSTAVTGQLALIGTVTIPPNDAKSVAVPIVPKKAGEIEVEIASFFKVKLFGLSSWIITGADTVTRKLLVVPEGVEHNFSRSFILDPKGVLNDDQNKAVVNLSTIPRQFDSIDLTIGPEISKVIPGSIGAVVYLTGNLLGPVVNSTIKGGLESFFRQPRGDGETTMIYLAPNVYVLEYLMNTKQISGSSEENAYRFIQSGYQRELNYRRNDKSFSAFGEIRPGSTWLTAFVMRVFCKAQRFAGVNIDENLVCESVSWLIANQRADGALPEVHAVIHKEMVGGAYTEGDVAMTAFVLSALAECKCQGVNSQGSKLLAKEYLEKQYKTLNKPYSMALTAYALALVDSKEKLNANDRLLQSALNDNVKKSRYWNAGGNALNVETAGYALLTQIILGRTGYAGPIVTYLTNQRKGGVGFVSTQDTVVALQALALYSEKTAGYALDLRVQITSELDVDWKPPEIEITPENALLRREIDVKKFLGGRLYVESRGTGIGLLEVEIRYNFLSKREEICKFDLNTTVMEIKEQNSGDLFSTVKKKGCKGKKKNRKRCKNREKDKDKDLVRSINLKVCTRKKRQGKAGEMSIMDIGIFNGFIPNMKSLQKLQQNNTMPEFDKLELSDRSLVIYLREIPSDRELCVDVQFDREHHEGTIQAMSVNVYDFYEPDQSCSVFYGPDKSIPLKLGVCDAGSSSCKCRKVSKKIGCVQLLRNLLNNPPRHTHIAINIRLSKARYRCRAGYVLSGNEMRTCKKGRWNEEKEPKCMGPCRRPKHIPHAKFIGSSFKFKDKLRYICDKGYTLEGPRKRQCGKDRKWSKAPTCLKDTPWIPAGLDYSSCGESPADTRSLLSGIKQISKRGWWPWQIAIYRLSIKNGKLNEVFHCGGALISRQWVLTAAQCFYRRIYAKWRLYMNPTRYVIKAGVHNFTRREDSEQSMQIKKIIVHDKFNPDTLQNNIALLQLDQPLDFTPFVRTVCLPEKEERDLAIPETNGIAAGWGVTRAIKYGERHGPGDIPEVLHYSFLKIQTDQLCSIKAQPFFMNSTVTFCAGDGQRRSGTCTGDSGGAFVREAQRGDDKRWAWVATGIVSWGKGCAQKDEPGYYTRVYPFIDWIKETMDKN